MMMKFFLGLLSFNIGNAAENSSTDTYEKHVNFYITVSCSTYIHIPLSWLLVRIITSSSSSQIRSLDLLWLLSFIIDVPISLEAFLYIFSLSFCTFIFLHIFHLLFKCVQLSFVSSVKMLNFIHMLVLLFVWSCPMNSFSVSGTSFQKLEFSVTFTYHPHFSSIQTGQNWHCFIKFYLHVLFEFKVLFYGNIT